MAISDNLYSRFVAWSKILLPLAALGLLSTLFLFARNPGGTDTIPYAEIQDIARDPRVTRPQFSGMSDDGSVISITAESAAPDAGKPGLTTVTKLSASVESTDGARVDITSGAGTIDTADHTATMTGLARVTSSTGYVMETTGLTADLAAGRIESTGPLEVRAPYGRLTAAHLLIETPAGATGQVMVFNGGVRLVYQPQ